MERLARFSDAHHDDLFILSLEGDEILTGMMHLEVFNHKGDKIFDQRWKVGQYFFLQRYYQYLDKEQREERFWNILNTALSPGKFHPLHEMKVVGLMRSGDMKLFNSVKADPEAIAVSVIDMDMCLVYSKEFQKAFLIRALDKRVLRQYGINTHGSFD